MPFIEVQFSAVRLFELLREALREALVGATVDEWTAPGPMGGQQTLILDRIDVLDNTSFVASPSYSRVRWDDWPYHSGSDAMSSYPDLPVPSTAVAVTQELDLYPVLVVGRGTKSVRLIRLDPQRFSVSIDVEAVVVEKSRGPGQSVPPTAPALRFTPNPIALSSIPTVANALVRRAQDAILAAIGSYTQALPPWPIGNFRYSNGGVVVLGGGARLAVRFQTGLGSVAWTTTQWTDFYQGNSPDLLLPALAGGVGASDWGVRLDASLLATQANNEITRKLSASSSTVFLSNRGVHVALGPSGDHLRVDASAFLEVATRVRGITVLVELTLTVDLRVAAPGELEMHAAIHVALDNSIDTAALLVVAGAAIGAALGLATVIVPGAVLAVPFIVLGAVVVLGTLGPIPINVLPSSAPMACTETGLTVNFGDLSADKAITCTMPAKCACHWYATPR